MTVGNDRLVVHVTTSGPRIPQWTEDMRARAEAYANRYAEMVRRLWGLPFSWSVQHSRLCLDFPAAVRWTFGSAVMDWIMNGEGEMPEPHQFV